MCLWRHRGAMQQRHLEQSSGRNRPHPQQRGVADRHRSYCFCQGDIGEGHEARLVKGDQFLLQARWPMPCVPCFLAKRRSRFWSSGVGVQRRSRLRRDKQSSAKPRFATTRSRLQLLRLVVNGQPQGMVRTIQIAICSMAIGSERLQFEEDIVVGENTLNFDVA